MNTRVISFLFTIFCLATKAQVAPVMNPIQGPANVCSLPNAGGVYSCSASNNPITYQWSVMSPSTGIIIANPTSSVTQITFPNTNLNYTLVCTAANAGATATPVMYIVKVYETPVVSFSGNQSFCQGSSTNLSASPTIISASSSLSYSWNPNFGLTPNNSLNVVANPNATTTYSLFLSIATCTNMATITVTVNPPPSFTPVISNTLFCKLDTQTLTILGTGNTYSINNVLTPSVSLLNYSVSGGVLITVNAESSYGCKSNASITFSVGNCTVGIDDKQKLDGDVLIYPNPNKGTCFIKPQAVNQVFTIYDQFGRLVTQVSALGLQDIQVSDLTPGLYFISSVGRTRKILVY